MSALTLDHVVIAVRDLDAATADYGVLLGREPSWRGDHPAYGTRNTLYRIENTYIELLGLGTKKGRWTGELSKRLEHGEGLFALALGTEDMRATLRDVRDAGLEVDDARDGEGIDEISGAQRRWRNAIVPEKSSNGLRIFFIEHKSPPDALPIGPVSVESGYVERMDHAVVLSADMEVSRQLWSNVLGIRLALDRTFPDRNSRILFFRLGDITIEISGGAEQTEEGIGKPDRLWGMAWGVDNAQKACDRLRDRGVDVSGPRAGIKPGTLVATVKGEHTHGVATLLIEHTPESFRSESRLPQGTAHDNAPEQRAFRALALDHVSIAAEDITGTAAKWADVLGLPIEETRDVEGQPLRLTTMPAGNANIELMQPLRADHSLAQTIAERGQGMYGITILVDNIDEAVRDLRVKGISVGNAEYGDGDGTRIARINPSSANGVRIELIERRPPVL